MNDCSWSYFDKYPQAALLEVVEQLEERARKAYHAKDYEKFHELSLLTCEAMICLEIRRNAALQVGLANK